MKSIVTIAVVAVTASLAFASSAVSSQQPPPKQAWQHLALTQDDDGLGNGLGQQINKLGREGWELVNVVPLTKDGTTVKTRYYFKRPLR